MNFPIIKVITILTLLSLALTACQTVTPTPSDTSGESALVENIEFLTLESFPVQITAVVSGSLPDGCTTIDRTEAIRADNTFTIHLYTTRPADAVCTEALVPFKESVSLDVYGLPAGEYTVRAGDVTGTFRLEMDNILK
ncbi:MAG: hypothetical protein ABFD44_04300 [Anaerolineaceae bacterium]